MNSNRRWNGDSRACARGAAPCPPAEQLARFASGDLPADEAASIRAHVALCGACDAMLLRLRKFEEAKKSDSPVDAQEERMRAKVFPARRGPSVAVAVAGYAVAAGVLVCGYLGVLPKRNAERAAPPWEAAGSIDLNRVRGGLAPPVAKISSPFVVLSFFVDIRPDLRYQAVLDGGQAKRVTSYDGVGNFRLVVDRRLLGPGRHVLTVREANVRTLEFPFEVK